ncbi:hypothetical protein [Actinacidiphila glaucinigra]|uniref:Uncharacterized protein n=1 Tax=Actinacidiphila glaucinigra TaxID=235986 RepID=A0A239EYV6_9ACTN|nr:hypothetical protein [Actinacidiphila glaucinigra]SNS49809.1 hypothetical protein SAMN05216252_106224 [Actinacidiphila glaucinigra]
MKTVDFQSCECSDKRAFPDRRAAEKALGRAQAKRDRHAARFEHHGPIDRENRAYQCDYGMWHLTKQSRRSYEEWAARNAA